MRTSTPPAPASQGAYDARGGGDVAPFDRVAARPGSQFHEWLSEGDKIGRADEASGQRPRLALLSAGGAGACQMTW